MKNKAISFLRYNRFAFGDQIVSQFVIFECKWLFSVIVFYFHKCNSSQNRFHTHAFNALSVKLFGKYDEYILDSEETGEFHIEERTQILKWFPRDSYHKIGGSTGCCTILFSGRWKRTWKEYHDGEVLHYSWGREKLN